MTGLQESAAGEENTFGNGICRFGREFNACSRWARNRAENLLIGSRQAGEDKNPAGSSAVTASQVFIWLGFEESLVAYRREGSENLSFSEPRGGSNG